MGDINGDGFADLLVAAPMSPTGGTGSRLHVFLGGSSGVGTSPYKSIQFDEYNFEDDGRATETFKVRSVVRGGADVNGDGYADFVATSPQVDKLGSFTPFFGGAGDILPGSKVSPSSGNGFGRSVALCDLNGDRRTDMLIGAPESIGSQQASTVKIFHGVAARLEYAQQLSKPESFIGGQIGCADLSNDAYPEVVVGDAASSERNLYAGDVLVLANAAGVLSAGTSLSGQLDTPGAVSGDVLGTIGDMNGDGTAELAVGGAGWLRVMFSARDPSASDYVELINDPDAFGLAAVSRVLGADINGDGLSDLIVGSPDHEGHGRITIFRGNRTSRIVYPSTETLDAPSGVTGFGVRLSAGL